MIWLTLLMLALALGLVAILMFLLIGALGEWIARKFGGE